MPSFLRWVGDCAVLCKRYWISGRVQGVCFRMSTRTQALALGVTGWVRNLVDGRVEAVACGSQEQLASFERWLHEGPELARVDSVIATEQDYTQFDSFELR